MRRFHSSFYFLAFFAVFSSLFFVHFAEAQVFSRTLVLGSQGSDVLSLQTILNSDPYTQVASNGPGSPGQETAYFGTKTRIAVMNFQKKYAPEVLFPAGIWQPTGTVGTYTRAKLNSLSSLIVPTNNQSNIPDSVTSLVPPLESSTPAATNTLIATLAQALVTKSRPLLFNMTRYEASHGQSVTVNGSGFLPTDNSVVFGNGLRIDHLPSTDGSTLTFVVPNSVSNGAYNLSVENKNGTTFDASYGNFFTVTDTPTGPPVITSINPATILVTDIKNTITITGENFDTTNSVYSSLGNLSNVSSDGKTITFSLASFDHTATLIADVKARPVSFPVYLFVKNSHGVTLTAAHVILDFK